MRTVLCLIYGIATSYYLKPTRLIKYSVVIKCLPCSDGGRLQGGGIGGEDVSGEGQTGVIGWFQILMNRLWSRSSHYQCSFPGVSVSNRSSIYVEKLRLIQNYFTFWHIVIWVMTPHYTGGQKYLVSYFDIICFVLFT